MFLLFGLLIDMVIFTFVSLFMSKTLAWIILIVLLIYCLARS